MKSILIANRGEIAARIQRTAHKMGIKTIAAYSDFDRNLPHLQNADRTFRLGEPLSYLNIQKIINAAIDTDADAIHPGYGFLSENADFAKACKDNRIIFIGPSKETLKIFGNKSQTRSLAKKLKIPIIKGFKIPNKLPDIKEIKEKVSNLKWPLMIKAAAGGGGKGMRVVKNWNEFKENLKTCSSEAINSFGSGELLVEEALVSARHIEVQIVSDGKNYLHFFERDCSVQRRYQKVIEIAPSFGLNRDIKEQLYCAALSITRAAKLKGIATVEFLVRGDCSDFFLLEVNPRIQVEHPVTEEITGHDLVKLQIEIASGRKLTLRQKEILCNGFAVESRLTAENPYHDFLPQVGKISSTNLNAFSKKIYRVEENLSNELLIGNSYDSLIAKLITKGKTLNKAFENQISLLNKVELLGLQSNLPFLIDSCALLSKKPDLVNTDFINDNFKENITEFKKNSKNNRIIAAMLASFHFLKSSKEKVYSLSKQSYLLEGPCASETIYLKNILLNGETLKVECGDQKYYLKILNKNKAIFNGKKFNFQINHKAIFDNTIELSYSGFFFTVKPDLEKNNNKTSNTKNIITSPVPGTILKINKKKGEQVLKNETILILESMKIEHSIKIERSAKIKEIKVKKGTYVDSGEVLVILEELNRN